MSLRQSLLHTTTIQAANSLVEEHGWELPAAFQDVSTEYSAFAQGCALHDLSYAGRLKATGADTLDLLNRLSTNKVIDLEPGQGAPTILTTDRGRILDLIVVINIGEYMLLITSPGNEGPVAEWLDKYTILEDLVVEEITASTSMLSVSGPESQNLIQNAGNLSLKDLPPLHTLRSSFGGNTVEVISHPLGDVAGYYLLMGPEAGNAVWQALVQAGATPVGIHAYEAARINYSLPALGKEMGEAYNPLEAGLIGSIDFAKGCYIGQEIIARLDTYQKVQKHLARLAFSGVTSVEEGTALEQDGTHVGVVTSVTTVPSTGEIIGLGYVRKANASVGSKLELAMTQGGSAEILSLPLLFGPDRG